MCKFELISEVLGDLVVLRNIYPLAEVSLGEDCIKPQLKGSEKLVCCWLRWMDKVLYLSFAGWS